MGMGWVGNLCAGLFYEHRFAMLINQKKEERVSSPISEILQCCSAKDLDYSVLTGTLHFCALETGAPAIVPSRSIFPQNLTPVKIVIHIVKIMVTLVKNCGLFICGQVLCTWN